MNAWSRGVLALGLIVASAQMARAAAEHSSQTPIATSSALPHDATAEFNLAQLMEEPAVGMTEAEDDFHEHTPGWTGRTLVPGSSSTLAGAADATEWQQMGSY
jgi:predicted membrane-bound mannosyltransferase